MENERRITRSANALLPERGFVPERLLAPNQALSLYFSHVALAPVGSEDVGLDAAAGRILSETLHADRDYPPIPRSTMDGFAIASSHAPGAFAIAGDVRMGTVSERHLMPGETMRIPTGGAVPRGADAVVPVEAVHVDGGTVRVDAPVPAGDCITPPGDDMRAGETVLTRGTRIGAAQLGVLATIGCTAVPVYRRPQFAILSSGDELVDASATPGHAQIRDSNRYAIAGALAAMGAIPRHIATVGDDPAALERAVAGALSWADAVVLSGGSSVGAADYTPRVLDGFGPPGVVVHGLRVKPGKPTVLGAAGRRPLLGLPGNPASALMILEGVAAPIVAALTGACDAPREIAARAGCAIRGRPGWTWFVPVALSRGDEWPVAEPLGIRSSFVSLLARAGGYVVVGEDGAGAAAGEPVRVRLFSGGSG
ncbi:MAG: molybdopterin molybdotransferase MoeA [Candidatus Eremiobacteraeota bacterium]|nr:molybdopterin molybdotransferase MoeA [Candidatus Eremiobacteraeota bacterium]